MKDKQPTRSYKDYLLSFVGSFTSIALLGYLNGKLPVGSDNFFLLASFGASCVIIYSAKSSPFAQPRNLIGGHVISAFIGVTIHYLIPDDLWLAGALAVASCILAMQITQTLHPPGGATCLTAIIGSEKIRSMGYWYILNPVLLGVIIIFLLALVFNNITSGSYPANLNWRPFSKPHQNK